MEHSPFDHGGVFPDLYRLGFAQILNNPNDRFTRAYHGDAAALHYYLTKSLDPTLDGEYAETYSYELFKLLLGAGDSRFATALRTEPSTVREAVGRYIDPFIGTLPRRFTQTRLSYTYRYVWPDGQPR